MTKSYKPSGYNSVSPYFVADEAQKLMDLLIEIFGGKELRKYSLPDGSILHAEIQIDDSVLMFGSASEQNPSNIQLNHVYVKDVDSIYNKALDLGCESVQVPTERENDPDKRGGFRDFAGNMWSIGTQVSEEG